MRRLTYREKGDRYDATTYALDKHIDCVRKHIYDICDILHKEYPDTKYLYDLKDMIQNLPARSEIGFDMAIYI